MGYVKVFFGVHCRGSTDHEENTDLVDRQLSSVDILKRMSKHKEELGIFCRAGIIHP